MKSFRLKEILVKIENAIVERKVALFQENHNNNC